MCAPTVKANEGWGGAASQAPAASQSRTLLPRGAWEGLSPAAWTQEGQRELLIQKGKKEIQTKNRAALLVHMNRW